MKEFEKTRYPRLRINDELEWCNVLNPESFAELLQDLNVSPFMDDSQKYWVLYESNESFQAFWVCPLEEIRLAYSSEWGWTVLEDGQEVLIMSEDEDDSEEILCVSGCEDSDFELALKTYAEFESDFLHYLLYDKRADADTLKFWQNLQKCMGVLEPELVNEGKVFFIIFLQDCWKCWLDDVLNNTFNYMNITRIVWDSWESLEIEG